MGHLAAQAAYWTSVNTGRWAQARMLEARTGVAVCDSDPLKLHYSWSLAQIGAAKRPRFDHEVAQVRRTMTLLGMSPVAFQRATATGV